MKKKLEVEWAAAASSDLDAIHGFLEERNPDAFRKLSTRIAEVAKKLEHFAELGPICPDIEPVGTYRHVVIPPYRLIYRRHKRTIYILRLWDARRDPRELLVPQKK